MTRIVAQYLAAFGPASRADVAQWSVPPLSVLEPGLEGLTLRRFRDEQGRELLDLPRLRTSGGYPRAGASASALGQSPAHAR